MAETCGGVGFYGKSFAPVKKRNNPITNYLERRRDFRQQQKIQHLEEKSKAEGLSIQEKIDLAANKIDSALRNGDFPPTVIYSA